MGLLQENHSGTMADSARLACTIVCLLSLVVGTTAQAESPLLSSKAIRTSLQAKKAIEGHDEKALQAAVDSLQALLREPSFRRLEPQAQVHILLLLSKGFERLENYKEQEQLLLSYAKKEELYRFQAPLKTTLARSLIQQHRFVDAEHLLSKIIKASCAHLPLEDKGALANVLVFRDEYLSYLLRQGDGLADGGKWEEALTLLTFVLSTIDRQQFPYQSSSVEKKRIREKLRLRIAEVHFCLGHFQETVTLLHDWDEALFFDSPDQPLLTRRLFLIASAHLKLNNTRKAYDRFAQYFSSPFLKNPFLDRHLWCSMLDREKGLQEDAALSPALLLWKAQEALRAPSPEIFSQIVTLLQDRVKSKEGVVRLLHGFQAALEQNLPLAVQELMAGLSAPSSSLNAPWREAAFHLLAECGFERVMLLTSSNQPKEAEEVARRLLPLFTSSNHPNTQLRLAALNLFLYRNTRDPSYLSALKGILDMIEVSDSSLNHSLFSLLLAGTDPKSPPADSLNPDSLSASDRFFGTWLGIPDMMPAGAEQPFQVAPDNQLAPFSRYISSILLYSQAMADEIPADHATAALQDCLEGPTLIDVRPQLLHCLVDLAIHTNQYAEADELIGELLAHHPSYPCLPQAVLSCIFAFEEVPNVADDRNALIQYIFQRQNADIHTLLLMLHLFETRQQLPSDQKNAAASFGLALIARSEARTIVADALKSKEPSVIKERVESAKKSFDTSRAYALESLSSLHDSEGLCFVWGLILGMENEQIEVLQRYITTDSSFNELPSLLEDAARTLRLDLDTVRTSIPLSGQSISISFLHSCLCLSHTADIYAETFRRNLEEAISKIQGFPEAWYSSRQVIRLLLYVSKALRESKRSEEAMGLLSRLRETEERDDIELALEIAMEKSLCLRELHRPDKAMALLAWVINGPYASSLRVKAMILRADLYLSLHRKDLAVRQLESVAAKGGEWGAVADRKLRELYGTN